MDTENRQHTRFKEIGKAMASELCSLPAILDDISATGCKIHYSYPVVVDLDSEYEIKVSPLHNASSNPLNLICVPQWVQEIGGNTFIGFKILYSPDANKLNSFIKHLEDLLQEDS